MSDFRLKLFAKPEVKQQLETFGELIRSYSGSATYFVRKISAQSLLPLLHFSAYVTEIKEALATFTRKAKDQSLKQNEAHGLIVRVNVFLEAYFKYRHIAVDQEMQAAQFV